MQDTLVLTNTDVFGYIMLPDFSTDKPVAKDISENNPSPANFLNIFKFCSNLEN